MSELAKRVNNYTGLDTDKIGYWYHTELECWFVYIPRCGAGRLSEHTVVEHEDSTITVTPSIKMTGHDKGTPTERHGYLTRGVWSEC